MFRKKRAMQELEKLEELRQKKRNFVKTLIGKNYI
tara:strand:- start:173 stop:277 length:105 start_codon:yes stop_codon:yes gene_type:complete